MTGEEAKKMIQGAGLKLWRVAELWGVNDGNFSRRLRKPFDEAETERLKAIIEKLQTEKAKTA